MPDVTIDSWLRVLATDTASRESYCLMCLRVSTEKTLVEIDKYWELLARLKNPLCQSDLLLLKKNRKQKNGLCRECRGLLRRCSLILDALQHSYELHKFTRQNLPELAKEGLIIVSPELVSQFTKARESRKHAMKLSVTETLVVENTCEQADTSALQSPPAQQVNNIILVPAYSQQVMQMAGGSGLQLMQLMQPLQMVNAAPQYQIVQPSPATQRQAQATVSESIHVTRKRPASPAARPTPAAPAPGPTLAAPARPATADPLAMPEQCIAVEDERTIAFIETDISQDSMEDYQIKPIEWITPDITTPRTTLSNNKISKTNNKTTPANKKILQKTEESLPRPVRLLSAAEFVVSLDSSEDEECPAVTVPTPALTPAPKPPPSPGRPRVSGLNGPDWEMAASDVDWEDEIPTEVIATEVENPQQFIGTGMGRILCVRSHADVDWQG